MTAATPPVGVVGLGYVGLPLAVAFGRITRTVGFDIDPTRVQELAKGFDRNKDVPADALASPELTFADQVADLAEADFFIVAVPTPVDQAKRPDLGPLLSASRSVGEALKLRATRRGARPTPIVVFESTVYPGCTEEDCRPVIETASGLVASRDFKLGYSPERINPGDPAHTLRTIKKVVSGEDPETLERVASVYGMVVEAGIHRAPDIRTAEAAKVIENTQRDLNIALMNELSILFHRMGIDTKEVLAAARTKWNFLPFTPGLVGGHCIPVDPYYLTHKAEEFDYSPQVILAGRRINDNMGRYVAQEAAKLLARSGRPVNGAKALVLGVAFKEDVADARDTRVFDLIEELEGYGVDIVVHDPVVGNDRVRRMGLAPAPEPVFGGGTDLARYDLVVLAVAHRTFREQAPDAFLGLLRANGNGGILVDVKGHLPAATLAAAGAVHWTL